MIVNRTDGRQVTVDSAKSYAASRGYTFPVYCDTDLGAAHTYGVYSIPTTPFSRRRGVCRGLRQRHAGP